MLVQYLQSAFGAALGEKKKKVNKRVFKVIKVWNYQIQLKFVEGQWPFQLISISG